MKKQTDPITVSTFGRVHSIHYLHSGNTSVYKPYSDNKGIHCSGDRFSYVVDWQITEKRGAYSDRLKTAR